MAVQPSMPRDPALDGTMSLLREGYAWASRRCERLRSDEFRTRVMGRPAICWHGIEAARAFYDEDRFVRWRPLPSAAAHLLHDRGTIAALEGDAHRERRALFREMLAPDRVRALVEVFTRRWRKAVADWRDRGQVRFHDEMCLLLSTSAAEWAGVPLRAGEVLARTRELAGLHDSAPVTTPDWRAIAVRRRLTHWARERLAALREGRAHASPDSGALALIGYRDDAGRPLDETVAALELLNLLRPIVATARSLAFTAVALHAHPDWRSRCATGDARVLDAFAREVLRFYPFFPLIGARVRRDFEWHGHRYRDGEWVLLDVYGTDHDESVWPHAQAFDPERFLDAGATARLVAQGTGSPECSHRCPGEGLALALVGRTAMLLGGQLRWCLPVQDLEPPLDRIPALPRSGVILSLYPDDGAPAPAELASA